MKIGFEVFLVVAREMSITKAANEIGRASCRERV